MRTRIPAALLAALLPLLGACSQATDSSPTAESTSPSTSSPSTSTANGNWVSVSGVTFRLPKGWQQIDSTDVAGVASSSNPTLQGFADSLGITLDQFKQMASQVDLWAFAPKTKHGFVDNVNVINSGQGSLPTAAALRQELQGVSAKMTSFKKISTDAGNGIRYSYTLASGSLSVTGEGIAILIDGNLVTFTFSATARSDAKALASLAETTLRPAS